MTFIPAVDVSQWQVATPNPDGAGLVICRATYNTGYDTRYAQHAADTRAQGDYLGAYAFGRPGDGAAQARVLLATAPDVDLMLVGDRWCDLYALDLEPEHGVEMSDADARAFIAEMHRQGHQVGLYHSASGYPELGQDWRWVADWRGPVPSIPWDIWQWTNKAADGSPLDRDWCRRQLKRKEKGPMKNEPVLASNVAGGGLASLVLLLAAVATGQTFDSPDKAIGALMVVALPFVSQVVSALIGRQFVTPNSKVVNNGDGTATPVASAVTSPGSLNAADIAALKRYIANLEAVKNPTEAQMAKLDAYLARLASYEARLAPVTSAAAPAAPATTPSEVVAPLVVAPVTPPAPPAPASVRYPQPVFPPPADAAGVVNTWWTYVHNPNLTEADHRALDAAWANMVGQSLTNDEIAALLGPALFARAVWDGRFGPPGTPGTEGYDFTGFTTLTVNTGPTGGETVVWRNGQVAARYPGDVRQYDVHGYPTGFLAAAGTGYPPMQWTP